MVLFIDIYAEMIEKITDSSIAQKLPNLQWDYSKLQRWLNSSVIVDFRPFGTTLEIIKPSKHSYFETYVEGTNEYELVDFMEGSESYLTINNVLVEQNNYEITSKDDKFYLHILNTSIFDEFKDFELATVFSGAFVTLEDYDKIFLISAMLQYWIEPFINDTNYLLTATGSTRDYKENSHANLLKELRALRNSYRDYCEEMVMLNTLSEEHIEGLG